MSTNRDTSTSKLLRLPTLLSILFGTLALAIAIVAGCSSGINSSSTPTGNSTLGTASVRISDPSTCTAPNGPYAHVYITVADIQAHTSAHAGANDAGWVDLTPNLPAAPVQIDLLGQANNQCFLATLGATQQLQPGNYQQIRVILADTASLTSGKGDACTNGLNCVVLNDGSTYPLQLSSESKTGIKIPLGQIANGGFHVGAGQTKDLDIDFDTCDSIVQNGDGTYQLKPVLHAGEVSSIAGTSINGTVVDSATGSQINGVVTVALEQKDANGIDRVFMSTMTDSNGMFVFCPLPSGTYDVVIVGRDSTGVVYSPTVVTGVTTGSTVSTVALHALPGVSAGAAVLQGQVTTQNGANPPAGTAAHVQISTLETVASSLTVTVPLVPSYSSVQVALATANNLSCPAGTDCTSYNLKTSAGPAFVGTYSSSGITLTPSALPASYIVDGLATVPASGGTADCTNSELKAPAVTPVVGVSTSVATLAYTGCQ
ncbi:DUF4382 domain-containing protein [Edaphobacter bradus]|uniref:DUF4382 domain-containing protein n=1 Tax=Edaphobacter bradus TaxID=2259016 RepID=UPI0021E0D969|nr:DUF4382 domain-containing protein [Edaphobacter bradus]